MSKIEKGDICVYVGAKTEHLGRVFTALSPVYHERGKAWIVDPRLCEDTKVYRGDAIFEVALKPLRDGPGEDEMLRIAGKPKTSLLDECNRLIADFNKLADWCKEHQK